MQETHSPFIDISSQDLDCGMTMHNVRIAYQTWGTLNADKSNAILLCHALTGDQYALGTHPITGKAGWAELFLGSGKAIDTDKFFVICSNVLGSCMGSTGPSSTNPETNKPYGLKFPAVTINDMVRAQYALVQSLGINTLSAVIGASMGGMQALTWAHLYGEYTQKIVAIACTHQHSAQNIAFHEVGRQAIMADPAWQGGDYYDNEVPHRGLAVARMTAHITYMSENSLAAKFGRNLQGTDKPSWGFDTNFQVESYLHHQGITFVDRFDANSYLYLTRAVDYYDLSLSTGNLSTALSDAPQYLIMSLSSDWLYPPSEHRTIVKALNAKAAQVSYVDIDTDKGHDGFLHETPTFHDTLSQFFNA